GLLVREGYQVTGIAMCFSLSSQDDRHPTCCGRESIADAQQVAHQLGIPHFVLSFRDALEEYVISDFCREYVRGRTPNPCVRCNQFLKFGLLLEKARALGYDFLATGHYAQVAEGKDSLFHLLRGVDRQKDQSYFLYRLTQRQLGRVLFPLGRLKKGEVRELAAAWGLSVAGKAESQEICFVPENDYRAFLRGRMPDARTLQPGEIVDVTGKVLGTHEGAALYTVGQRAGLGIAHKHALYVVRIDAARNRVIVGARTDAERRSFCVEDVTWCAEPLKGMAECVVKVRYNHGGARARIIAQGGVAMVECNEPVFAVTPGQSAVFYHDEEVVGGGIISSD
ncbi:MAG: tRNA 2-thiouridine(34) synthase MnmA, partial [bacterium]|nr:tRNA 2-thiouridine(34) synthase MnmA [bacterium]